MIHITYAAALCFSLLHPSDFYLLICVKRRSCVIETLIERYLPTGYEPGLTTIELPDRPSYRDNVTPSDCGEPFDENNRIHPSIDTFQQVVTPRDNLSAYARAIAVGQVRSVFG